MKLASSTPAADPSVLRRPQRGDWAPTLLATSTPTTFIPTMSAHIQISVPSRRQRASQLATQQNLPQVSQQPEGVAPQGGTAAAPAAIAPDRACVDHSSADHSSADPGPAPRGSIPPLQQLAERYAFFYDHGLVTQVAPTQWRSRQAQVQNAWEVSICHVVTDQILRWQRQDAAGPGYNPTLLSQGHLEQTIHHFLQELDSPSGTKQVSQKFRQTLPTLTSFGAFKRSLYVYLKLSEQSFAGAKGFNQRLEQVLRGILPVHDEEPLTDLLLLRTCTQLLSYWVVESHHQREHYRFLDLITHLGPLGTVSWLLRILLLCPNAQRHLEKRFAILFNHYSDIPWQEVQWLVQTLEVLAIALVLHLSEVNLPLFHLKA